MNRDEILQINRRAYDAMAGAGEALCRPAKDEELADPLGTLDSTGWLGASIAGWRVLCLAAGGGRQSSLYAAAGAEVTVVDLSGAMLELDRRVAAERGFSVRLFETSMDDLSMLGDEEFDLVVHPVSTCYVPEVAPVFAEVARVLGAGGLYISQHKTPTSLQSSMEPDRDGRYHLNYRYYRRSPLASETSSNACAKRLRETATFEFIHRWEQILGGICRAGFVVEDLVEPVHARRNAATGSFAHRAAFIAPYVRIKARRAGPPSTRLKSRLWLPNNSADQLC